jgi:hypothetical protein
MSLASPVVALHALALALAAIAPLAWPMAPGRIRERPRDESASSTTAIASPNHSAG